MAGYHLILQKLYICLVLCASSDFSGNYISDGCELNALRSFAMETWLDMC